LNAPQIVEAVLFASDAPLTPDEIARADQALDEDRVEEALQLLQAEYEDAQRAFQLVEVAGGYQLLTRPEYAPYLERFDNVPRPARLSGPSIETLAIIAYRQPIGRLEVEYVRGVGATGVIRTLQDRRLIDVVGRGEGLGRPLLYGTTPHFLEHFGFKSLEGLPRPDELPIILRERLPLGAEEDDGESRDTEEDEQDGGQQEPLALNGAVAGDGDPDAEAAAEVDAGTAADADADAGTEAEVDTEVDTEPDTVTAAVADTTADAEVEADDRAEDAAPQADSVD
jgi:segregation and condensation protein B